MVFVIYYLLLNACPLGLKQSSLTILSTPVSVMFKYALEMEIGGAQFEDNWLNSDLSVGHLYFSLLHKQE